MSHVRLLEPRRCKRRADSVPRFFLEKRFEALKIPRSTKRSFSEILAQRLVGRLSRTSRKLGAQCSVASVRSVRSDLSGRVFIISILDTRVRKGEWLFDRCVALNDLIHSQNLLNVSSRVTAAPSSRTPHNAVHPTRRDFASSARDVHRARACGVGRRVLPLAPLQPRRTAGPFGRIRASASATRRGERDVRRVGASVSASRWTLRGRTRARFLFRKRFQRARSSSRACLRVRLGRRPRSGW